MFLLGVPVCLILSFVFFFLSSMISNDIDINEGTNTRTVLTGDLYQDTSKIANTIDKV